MKYFIDPDSSLKEMWDIQGYKRNLEELKPRLGQIDSFFQKGLHDWSVNFEMTEIEAHGEKEVQILLHLHNRWYQAADQLLLCQNVVKFDFSYDAFCYRFAGTQKKVKGDGFGDILVDEVTAYDAAYLQLELLFSSTATTKIVSKRFELKEK